MANVETWRLRRRLYHAGLLVLFCAVAFYFGPNRLLFDKWTWVTPADYIPVVRSRCEPVVRAMKAYRAAHGKLPDSSEDIGLSSHDPTSRLARIHRGRIYCGASPHNDVWYDFTPGHERWMVGGAFVSGEIPYPPVPDPPTTRP